ncbi:MAG: aminotransferase class I/II-fold pyridoxal phosphate-dependent enzyme [Bacteroidetes bacterium]|nr:aminotransferase class I/II-fold pyridoxal phosphate-dependent enzyme [Bacteroidota bacterium]
MILSESASRLFPQPMFELQTKVKELEKQGKDFIHFEIGDPDIDCDESIKDKMMYSIYANHTHYTPAKGIQYLINAICNKHDVKPENVLVTPGANISMFYVLSCLCNEGDTVAIPNPGFPTYKLVADYLKLNVIDYTNIIYKKYIDCKCIVVNNPCNPTGKNNLLPYYTPFTYRYNDNIYFDYNNSYDLFDANDINVYSFSKQYAMTGFRLGYIIANPELINKMEILLNITNSCVPEFIQRAGIAALQTDNSKMIEMYRERRDVLVEGLNKIDGIECELPDGTFYAFPNITKTGLTSKEFSDKMIEAGVALLPGTDFGSNGEGHVRLSFASTNIEQIKEGLRRIKKCL